MKKKRLLLCGLSIFLIGIAVYCSIPKKHTFPLSNANGITKSEQIQPLFGTAKVRSDQAGTGQMVYRKEQRKSYDLPDQCQNRMKINQKAA